MSGRQSVAGNRGPVIQHNFTSRAVSDRRAAGTAEVMVLLDEEEA